MNKSFLVESLKSGLFSLSKPYLSKINKYRNFYKNDDCYFFGNGVSLKWFEMQHFADKVSFGSSVLPFHNSFHNLDTHFIFLTEPF